MGLKTGLIQALSERERQSPGFRINGVTHNDRDREIATLELILSEGNATV